MTDQPTYRPGNQQTDGQSGSLESYTVNNRSLKPVTGMVTYHISGPASTKHNIVLSNLQQSSTRVGNRLYLSRGGGGWGGGVGWPIQ